mmetsp:Transcript_61866/g.143983  ORF Transcript_61866/g.143983 Transcript_61866/m.143983 type:complete len:244 (-) Transcript_61866:365-1096(-)
MRGDNVRAPDSADASVCGKDDNRAQRRFKGTVEIGETLYVQHVDLVNEEYSWYQLRNALIYVPVDNLVDLKPELLGDLSFPGFHEGAHDAGDVLASLRLGIRLIQVMECYVLHNLLLLVHIALGHWHVLICLKIELCSIVVAAADAPRDATVCLNVDDVPDLHLLLLQALVDLRCQFQRLLTFGGLEANHHGVNLLSIASCRVRFLLRCQLSDLTFIDLLGLLDADANGTPAILHEDLGLLHL